MANRIEMFVHLVWATREREPLLTAELEPRLHARLAAKCRELRCIPIAVGGTPDHVHVLVALHPTTPVALLVKESKGATSHHFSHVLSPGQPFAWQGGYAAFTLRAGDIAAVRRYILHQKEHHSSGNLLTVLECA